MNVTIEEWIRQCDISLLEIQQIQRFFWRKTQNRAYARHTSWLFARQNPDHLTFENQTRD